VSRANELRERADRLLAMAVEANTRGESDLANQLTLRAMQYLEHADDAATSSDRLGPAQMTRGLEQTRFQRQQQQARSQDD
jgi:hypothetical protein